MRNTSTYLYTTLHNSWLILLLIFLLSIDGFSQNKKLDRAKALYEIQNYNEAIPLFKKVLEDDKGIYTAVKLIANSYRKIKSYENAELYYVLAINSDSSVAEDHLYYGQVLKANGKLSAAKEQFLKFSETSNNDFMGKMMLNSIDEIETWKNEPKEFFSQAKQGINSPYSEYGLQQFQDVFYFTSNREKNENSPEASIFDGTPYYGIYEISKADFEKKEGAKIRMATGLLNSDYHDGPLTINQQGTKLIITRIGNDLRGKDFINRMKLYEADYESGRWKNFKEMPFNSNDYSVCHANFSDSGKTIIFASDMPGGYGGFDLYQSKWDGSTWSSPKNLGPAINTSQNEVYPYVNHNFLYFSSNGFAGYGGLDIYRSQSIDGTWQSPDNLKDPINSGRDDFSIYFVSDSAGYYSSGKEGGIGGDDFYEFKIQDPNDFILANGLLEFEGAPVAGAEIVLLDKNGNMLSTKTSDKSGRFSFAQLPYKEDFFVQVKSTDPGILKSGRMFMTDGKGEKMLLMNRLVNGNYAFTAVNENDLALLAGLPGLNMEQDGSFRFLGKIYKKLPGDVNSRVKIMVYSEQGLLIDSVYTDQFGKFDFKKLASNQDYFLKIEPEDPELNLAILNEFDRISETLIPNANGKFQIGKPEDPTVTVQTSKNKGMTALIARLEMNGVPQHSVKVNIYNKSNKLIGSVFTNMKGELQFNKMEFDELYYLELPRYDSNLVFKTSAYVINSAGKPLFLLKQLIDGRYEFNSLPFDEFLKKQLMVAAQVPDLVQIAGQIYRKLPGDHSEGMKVYVVNSEGMIIDSVLTDGTGKFKFEKLASDETYTFKLKDSEGMNLALLGNNDEIVELATLGNGGSFSYKKLTYQVSQFELLEEEDNELVSDSYSLNVNGQVFQNKPGDFKTGMKVFIYNEKGELMQIVLTDREGKFVFEKLSQDANYYFKVEDEDDSFQLVTLDENDKVLERTISKNGKYFRFSKLQLDQNEILLAEERDILIIDPEAEKVSLKGFKIYYRFDRYDIRPDEKLKLDSLIAEHKNTRQVLEVHSYTDNRGDKSYNIDLSKKRTDEVIRYLSRNGFPRNRIIGNYSGELNPVVDCDKKECDNDDHYLNRRSEFKLLQTIQNTEEQ